MRQEVAYHAKRAHITWIKNESCERSAYTARALAAPSFDAKPNFTQRQV
jgi:hypothetical protein